MRKRKKIVLAYGTRPEIIKMAPLVFELQKRKNVDLIILNSGQHREMVADLEDLFGFKADHYLNVMTHDQSLTDLLAVIVQKAAALLNKLKPDLVLVQGDTTTVLSIGLCCFYNHIPVGHVEAGLRSFDLQNPFPEELNRKVISSFAKYNFVPTKLSAQNLYNEKVKKNNVFITGNTVVDALHFIGSKIGKAKKNTSELKKILITAHRRENHGEGIKNICLAIKKLIAERKDIEFIWPVHPNPNVHNVVYSMLSSTERVTLLQPLPYLELVKEMMDSYLIWTDSGGIQEEAPSLKKPVLILREVTERPEVLTSGFGKIVGINVKKITDATIKLLDNKILYKKMISGKNPFGNGDAAKKITNIILK